MEDKEILIIGTDPPCPRCGYLSQMAHDLINETRLPVRVRHIAYTEAEARRIAGSMGLVPGTAKDVAQKAGVPVNWEKVYALMEGPKTPLSETGGCACCETPAGVWTPELDEALRSCEEAAVGAGIMMTPVALVGGVVKHQGSVPSRERFREWIKEAFAMAGEQESDKMVVEVLGTGCANCEDLYRNVFLALDKTGMRENVLVKKVRDIDYFLSMGVFRTPGLVINGKVVSTGKTLSPERIVEYLTSPQ